MKKGKVNNYLKNKLEHHVNRWLEVDQQLNLRARAREEGLDSLYEESETREGRIVGGKPIRIVHEILARGALMAESIPMLIVLSKLGEDEFEKFINQNKER